MNINFGKCPHCKTVVTRLMLEPVQLAKGPLGTDGSYNGLTYHCWNCKAVLGVEMDPTSLQADLVETLVRSLGKR